MKRFHTLEDWLAWQESLHPQTIDLGLERVGKVFEILHPDAVKPPTITVAGTNGKGSCIAFLESIYRAQGYRVGAYTSPHILKYNERIRIDGESVSDQLIFEAFERIDSARGDISLSYFEFGTLAALDIFFRSDLDVQLLEVGLGGRLDAVNIIDTDVAIITSICIDHVDWLGETREAIGQEKAGIFRPHKPAVVGDPEPPQSLLKSAEDKKTLLFRFGGDFCYKKHTDCWDWVSADKVLTQLPAPKLKGEHQYRNAASVIQAIEKMQTVLPVSKQSICQGLESVSLKGRFQLIDGDIPVLLDVSHNPQAVRSLHDYLTDVFPGKRIHAIFAMMKDKDIAGVVTIMQPLIYKWYIAPVNNTRVASMKKLQRTFDQCDVENVRFDFNNLAEAVVAVNNHAVKGDLILVFGSFFLVSEYLSEFDDK